MDIYLRNLINSTTPGSKIDLDRVKKAYDFANLAHTGQLRKSGEPYISHAVETAMLLISWQMDTDTVMAGLLHDTIEDGGATREDLVSQFGESVAQLVDGVTKISDVRLKGSTEIESIENLRKMILVMAKDLRVVFVKLADRLHNMRTIQYLSPEKQVKFAKETLQIHGPLADRLGMGEIAGELNDLSFQYAYQNDYLNLIKQTEKLYKDAEFHVEEVRNALMGSISPEIPGILISVRRKHLFSLYKKLQRPDIQGDISKIHDLVAARVITQDVGDCYVALGIIHKIYKPVPYLGLSDYIANPKPNGYQSLHTKVFGPEGNIIEIQVRTQKMHDEAEMGVAAHFYYSQVKESGVSSDSLDQGNYKTPQKLNWVKQLMTWQKEISDNKEFMNALEFDALAHRILVFSPIGDVYDLPRGASALDFAYAVHTDLGNQAGGAKVNSKMVGLDHKLLNGDVVEIIIDRKRSKPNSDWLSFVATHTAKSQISKVLRLTNKAN